jgi:hypothetical protein
MSGKNVLVDTNVFINLAEGIGLESIGRAIRFYIYYLCFIKIESLAEA